MLQCRHEDGPLRTAGRFPAGRRPAAGRGRAVRGTRRRSGAPDAAGRDRFRQDLYAGQRRGPAAAPGAGAGAQQDAGCPALRRVPGFLSEKPGRVLRFVLRLLPARSLRAFHRHLHREGRIDQPAHRTDAAVGDQGAHGTQGHDRGGHRFRDLRPGRSGHLLPDDPAPRARRPGRSARAAETPGGFAVHPQRGGTEAGHVPGARRRSRRVSRPSPSAKRSASSSSTTKSRKFATSIP